MADKKGNKKTDRLKPGQVLGPYRVVKLIGRGGMGEVYEALEERLGRRVALKIVSKQTEENEELLNRFLREGRSLAQVNHRNIVSIYAVDKINGIHLIAMEYVEGISISHMRRHFILNTQEAIFLFKQMLNGISALHSQKIIHRDIKPNNLILQNDGSIKLVDFGLAKDLSSSAEDLTETGAFFGTPRYLAPEVACGAQASFLSDIWALGAVFYEILAGEKLIDPKNKMGTLSILEKLRKFNFIVPSHMSGVIHISMISILRRMLHADVGRRYNDVNLIINDLNDLQKRLPQPNQDLFRRMGSELKGYKKMAKVLLDQKRSVFEVKRILTLALSSRKETPVSDDDATEVLLQPSFEFNPMTVRQGEVQFHREGGIRWRSLDEGEDAQKDISFRSYGASVRFFRLVPIFAMATFTAIIVYSLFGSVKNSIRHGEKASEKSIDVNSGLTHALPEFPKGNVIWLQVEDSVGFQWPNSVETARLEVSRTTAFRKKIIDKNVSGQSVSVKLGHVKGTVFWRLKNEMGEVISGPHRFGLAQMAPPELILPAEGSSVRLPHGFTQSPVNFFWKKKPFAKSYQLQISSEKNFKNSVYDKVVKNTQTYRAGLGEGAYYWRVRVNDQGSGRAWSQAYSFDVEANANYQNSLAVRPNATYLSFRIQEGRVPASVSETYRNRRTYAKNTPQFQWNPIRGVTQYKVQISKFRNFKRLVVNQFVGEPSFHWKDFYAGKFYWRVFAGETEKKVVSGNFYVSFNPVRGLRNFDVEVVASQTPYWEKNVPVQWEKHPFADEYKLEVSRSPSFSEVIQSVKSNHPSGAIRVSDVGNYFLRVQAVDQKGRSLNATSATATLRVVDGNTNN